MSQRKNNISWQLTAAATPKGKSIPYITCDVFSDKLFGGNPLAVCFDVDGSLSTEEMQRIANEFNYAESTFVRPVSADYDAVEDIESHDFSIRIFTPTREMPFAGHPNVGTALVLAWTGNIPDGKSSLRFREKAGTVDVALTQTEEGNFASAELTAPQAFQVTQVFEKELIAECLSIEASQVVNEPVYAGCGVSFAFAQVDSRETLKSIESFDPAFKKLPVGCIGLHVSVPSTADDTDYDVRVFCPEFGVVEDAATGSANVAFAGLLASRAPEPTLDLTTRIFQGEDMNRESRLISFAKKVNGKVEETRVGGSARVVMEGVFRL